VQSVLCQVSNIAECKCLLLVVPVVFAELSLVSWLYFVHQLRSTLACIFTGNRLRGAASEPKDTQILTMDSA
jgi:hypothetical protein